MISAMRRRLAPLLLLPAGIALGAALWALPALERTMPPVVALEIAMPAEGGALVPARSLRSGQVWVVEKETAFARPVSALPAGNGRVLVARGLAPGEAVVLDPPARLAEGQPLRLRP